MKQGASINPYQEKGWMQYLATDIIRYIDPELRDVIWDLNRNLQYTATSNAGHSSKEKGNNGFYDPSRQKAHGFNRGMNADERN